MDRRMALFHLVFITLLMALISCHQARQNNSKETFDSLIVERPNKLIPIRSLANQKEGFIDGTGKIIVPAEYSTVGMFSEGLAAVKKNGKCGFINTLGEVVIPLSYDIVFWPFCEGMAKVRVNSENWCGFIDKKGDRALTLNWYDGFWHYFSEGRLIVRKNESQGVISKLSGKEIVAPGKYEDISPFSEGMARVATFDRRYGFIDRFGKEIVPPIYGCARSFSEGMAPVQDMDNYEWGYIDNTGKLVIPMKYGFVGDFHEGLASVYKDGIHFYINKKGYKAIPFESNEIIRRFDDGLAVIGSYTDERQYLIDKRGVRIGSYYSEIWPFCQEVACVRRNNKYGFINKQGEEVIPVKYDNAYPFFRLGITGVELDGHAYVINQKGETLLKGYRVISGEEHILVNDK